MAVKNVLRMNPGDGETSYANNSGLQKVVISEALPVLEKTLKEMFGGGGGGGGADGFSKSLKMVDMGCSSGPNAIFVICHILDTIEDLYRKNDIDKSLVVEVFLNDLPDNDFNNLFKLLPSLSDQVNDKEKRQCFLYGLPGSFYGRLFPSSSLHFAYSSYSLHWLSQVPEGLKKNNKENIYMARTSPPEVFEAYAKQYQRDFFTFLSSRGDEIIPGGRMVLTFIGRSVEDPSREDDCAHLRLLSETLLDMVAEGLVKIDDLYSFNVPMYMPYYQEVERVIQDEGSFNLDKLQNFRVRWDAHDDNVVDEKGGVFRDKYTSGKLVADCVRAFMEPMLATHFGSSIVDQVFGRYAEKVAAHLSTEEGSYFTILISLRRI